MGVPKKWECGLARRRCAMLFGESVSRRRFVRVGAAAAAGAAVGCSPAAAPAPGPAAPSGPGADPTTWEKQWDDLVAAAKKEGTLSLVTTIGNPFQKAVAAFEAAVPGIKVDHTQLIASQFAPRVLQERQGGIHSYDIITTTYGTVPLTLIPAGVMDPIRPLLFRPDVVENRNWRGGFEKGFLDTDKKWGYGGFQEVFQAIWVNSDIIKDGQINIFDDLLDPRYKGKIVSGDPRNHGGGWWPATTLRLKRGEETARRFYGEHGITFSRDQRQMMDFLIKGQMWIGSGAVNEPILEDFLEKGVGKNLKYIAIDELDNLNHGSNVLYCFNRAPHPNAAKLFANWVLTKDGSAVWSKHAETNSRRTDVSAARPANAPNPTRNLLEIDRLGTGAEVEEDPGPGEGLVELTCGLREAPETAHEQRDLAGCQRLRYHSL
ncbi:MAG: extracellular solute-binding protein [Dehalococcoidia bacterium]|nr:extracellular solute-binding protein [Dehalococcoidia bacterium]